MSHARRLALLSFVLGFASGAFYLHSRGVLVRDQLEDFSASRTEISLVFTLIQVVNVAFAPLLGYCVDRFSLRWVMALGAVWLACGFAVLSQVNGLIQFAIVSAVMFGLGTGTIGTTANSKMMVNWFDRHRGIALSVPLIGYSFAGIVTPPAVLYLLDAVGWRGTYLVFGCMSVLVLLPLILHSASDASPHQSRVTTSEPARTQWHTFLLMLRSPPFWGAVLMFGSLSAVFGALNLHLFLHYVEEGIGDTAAAMILSLSAAGGLLSKPLFGWWVDRCGARTVTLIAGLSGVIALLSFAAASGFAGLLFAGVLFSVAFGGLVPVQAALISRLFSVQEFGRAYGALRLCMFPLALVATPLAGMIYDASQSYRPMFLVFALPIAIATVIVMWTVPRDLRDRNAG